MLFEIWAQNTPCAPQGPCKRTQHFWPTTCVRLPTLLHYVVELARQRLLKRKRFFFACVLAKRRLMVPGVPSGDRGN